MDGNENANDLAKTRAHPLPFVGQFGGLGENYFRIRLKRGEQK